jgi:hypothetical protein
MLPLGGVRRHKIPDQVSGMYAREAYRLGVRSTTEITREYGAYWYSKDQVSGIV